MKASILYLSSCKYLVSKMVVLEIKFDENIVMKKYTICHIVTIIAILIGRLTCCKEAKAMGIILDKH